MLNNRLLWPGMIGIALAVGLGVQMGESAIGSIDPIHFQGAAPPVQAIDPNAPLPPTSPYAQAYGWAQGNAARTAEAGNIAAYSAGYPDFDYLPEVRVHRASEPVWRDENAPGAPANLTPWPPGQVSSHPEVERYTDYPVEEKPAAPPAAAQPAPAPPAADPTATPPAATPTAASGK